MHDPRYAVFAPNIERVVPGLNVPDHTVDLVLCDGVSRKLGTLGNLPDRHLLAQLPAADEAQNGHLDHYC